MADSKHLYSTRPVEEVAFLNEPKEWHSQHSIRSSIDSEHEQNLGFIYQGIKIEKQLFLGNEMKVEQ